MAADSETPDAATERRPPRFGASHAFAQLARWDGNGVVVRYDVPTGTWIFIALHDSTLGRPTGGTRMKVYPEMAAAVEDAQRLAQGMTYKWAGTGLPFGGGKAVLAIPHPLEAEAQEGLFLRYGELLESLGGAFATGADLGTGPEAMAIIARRTRWVVGTGEDGRSDDPGPFTARGVFMGLQAAVGHVFGSKDLAGRRILVEGLGGVGEPLARSLAESGAILLLTDLDGAKAETLATELGGEAVALDEALALPCDVYAPCAIGATLNATSIPRLDTRIVAGSANNQLETPEDAERLQARGIVYVPDYVINAGGAIALTRIQEGEDDRQALLGQVEVLGQTVTEILEEAQQQDVSPVVAARRRVERLLAERRRQALDQSAVKG